MLRMRNTAAMLPMVALLAADPGVTVVGAADSPVRLDRATVYTAPDSPPVLIYAATNLNGEALEQFMVVVFVFDAAGTLKARQTAPARRTLEPHATKFSAMVLDGSAIAATDRLVIGVEQAQKVDSEDWWRADLRSAATKVIADSKK